MKLSIDYVRKSINENKLTYITMLAFINKDYNKLNLIITLATGFIPDYQDIFNLIQSYEKDELEYKEYQDQLEQEYIDKYERNI